MLAQNGVFSLNESEPKKNLSNVDFPRQSRKPKEKLVQLIKEVSTLRRYVNKQHLRMSTERSHHHDKPASQRLTTRVILRQLLTQSSGTY